MKEQEQQVFERINFYERYDAIVRENTSQARLETPAKEIVRSIIAEFDYDAKYFGKEGFYQVKQLENEVEFILNLILKYGRVEPVFFARSKRTGAKIGSVAMRIGKQLDLLRGVERPVSLGAPTFGSYEDLRRIIERLSLLYEDFKSEVLRAGVFGGLS